MKKIITTTLTIAIALFAFNVSAQLKGPAYKNASISEKYQGTSEVKVANEPSAIKGPVAKNNRFAAFEEDKPVVTASADGNTAAKKNYKVVDLQASETKYDKGLKGPKFKNYKSGK
ncbi:MAG: hypothetical protein KI791_23875 [Cyclobacteriaceae bacterium]|nr:hypothetical protein [Cyclobacteriaceae bacterium SS2]